MKLMEDMKTKQVSRAPNHKTKKKLDQKVFCKQGDKPEKAGRRQRLSKNKSIQRNKWEQEALHSRIINWQ